MNRSTVLHVLGLLLLFLAAAMLFPVPFAVYYADGTAWVFLAASGITAGAGYLLRRNTRPVRDLRVKDGFAIVTFGWLAACLFGSLPYLLSRTIPNPTDALFETISGFTTTGATILNDIEVMPPAILLYRDYTHWLGGMGIIVLSVAILPFLGIGGMQLFRAEAPGPTADRLAPRITQTAKILWGVYVLISATEVMLLLLGGMDLLNAFSHTFGTMGTGGFSTLNRSIGGFESAYIDYVIIIFMFIAGSSFALHYRFLRGDWRAHIRDYEFRWYVSIIVVAFVLIAFDTFVFRYGNVEQAFRDTLFQVVSITTTTGYGTADFEQWAPSSQFILFILMFIGASAGSTAGGMKIIRLVIVLKFVYNEITQAVHPHAVLPVRLGRTVVPRDVTTNVLGFFVLYLLLFAGGVLSMTALGLDLVSAFGAAAATLGNIGPGLGSVGPTDTYAHIPALGKWILASLMLLGRLEIFTVIVLLSPTYWRR